MKISMKYLNFFLFFALIFLSLMDSTFGAESGVAIRPAFMYSDNKVTQGGSSGQTRQDIDLALGYITQGDIYLGFMYHTPTITEHGATDVKTTYSGYGATLGYMGSGFYGLFTYYLSNTESVGSVSYSGGTHYQADVGYKFNVGGAYVAPQFVYYDFNFTQNGSGGTLNPTRHETGIIPEVAIWIIF